MQLRDYQQSAVNHVYAYLKQESGNPCVVIPTAGGKTPIIATIAHDVAVRWGGRCLILAHVKELLEQAVDKLASIAPDLPVGVYSAGLKRRDTDHGVIVAGIQSVAKRAAEIGAVDLVLVDEAHLIKPDDEGRYRTFLSALKEINPKLRIVGFTATPYRTGSGYIYGEDRLFDDVCYEVYIKDLVVRGYISKVVTRIPAHDIDMSAVRLTAGEFNAGQVSELYDSKGVVSNFVVDAVAKAQGRKSILVFCTSIEQAKNTVRMIKDQTGEEAGIVTGDTPALEREETLARFKRESSDLFGDVEPLRWLVNVNVLTTGFDAPNIDCICLFRPTASPVLYVQMVGRGFRLYPDKKDCLILDYGGNIRRFGPVDAITVDKKVNGKTKASVKTCPDCESVISSRDTVCPECGHVFERKPRKPADLADEADDAGILSGEVTTYTYDVDSVDYESHEKRNAEPGAPKTLQVNYHVHTATGKDKVIKEWLCPEHSAKWLRDKFEEWWTDRTTEKPPRADAETPYYMVADKAAFYAQTMGLAVPRQIVVEEAPGKLPRIIEYIDLSARTEPVVYTQQTYNDYGELSVHCYKCNECVHASFAELASDTCHCVYGYRLGDVNGVNACANFTLPEPEFSNSDIPF